MSENVKIITSGWDITLTIKGEPSIRFTKIASRNDKYVNVYIANGKSESGNFDRWDLAGLLNTSDITEMRDALKYLE